jgi:hypothetical protein
MTAQEVADLPRSALSTIVKLIANIIIEKIQI